MLTALGQSASTAQAVQGEHRSSTTANEATVFGTVAEREIDDPSTGRRWILRRDTFHPEGPGRLVPVIGEGNIDTSAAAGDLRPSEPLVREKSLQPVIRAGDEVVVEEHTDVIETRLAAVALGSAPKGGTFRARLKINGRVVRAKAVDAARAMLVAGAEAQP